MILILSKPKDYTTTIVVDSLVATNTPFFILDDLDSLIRFIDLTGSLHESLSKVMKMWLWKHPAIELKLDPQFEILKDQHVSEFRIIINYISNHPCPKLSGGIYNLNKLIMLDMAKKMGLNVPYTQIQTSIHKHSFVKQIVTKPVSEPVHYIQQGEKFSQYTTQITTDNLSNLQTPFFPSLIQEKIDAAYELRVIFINGSFFVVLQKDHNTAKKAIDIRKHKSTAITLAEYTLPLEVSKSIELLFKELGLNFGSVDLLYNLKESKYYFLELNPSGEFMYFSKRLNLGVDKKIVEFLLAK